MLVVTDYVLLLPKTHVHVRYIIFLSAAMAPDNSRGRRSVRAERGGPDKVWAESAAACDRYDGELEEIACE